MSDILNIERINAISPFMVSLYDSEYYDLETVCVETGLSRISVMGLPQINNWSDFKEIKDWDGNIYDPDIFYIDSDEPFDTKTD